MTEEIDTVDVSVEDEISPTEEASVEVDEVVTDYSTVADEDVRALSMLFPELSELKSITELENPLRFAALRDLGLSAEEAYLATAKRRLMKDNRAHLTASVPTGATPDMEMPRHDLEVAREMFSGLSDREIRALYRKVTK